MRSPSSTLVVDASILIAAACGKSVAAIEQVSAALVVVTTERALEEARRRLSLGMQRPELLAILDALAGSMTVFLPSALGHLIAEAERTLGDAVPSRNGSTRDAHLLALAWHAGADIWSPDRDFAGTGVASWSTPNLLRALAPADA